MTCARACRHCVGGELDIDGVVEEMGTRWQLDLVDTGAWLNCWRLNSKGLSGPKKMRYEDWRRLTRRAC